MVVEVGRLCSGCGNKPGFCICLIASYEKLSEFEKGHIAGLKAAAKEVSTHWNDSTTAVSQKGQAERSAKVLEDMAKHLIQFGFPNLGVESTQKSIEVIPQLTKAQAELFEKLWQGSTPDARGMLPDSVREQVEKSLGRKLSVT